MTLPTDGLDAYRTASDLIDRIDQLDGEADQLDRLVARYSEEAARKREQIENLRAHLPELAP